MPDHTDAFDDVLSGINELLKIAEQLTTTSTDVSAAEMLGTAETLLSLMEYGVGSTVVFDAVGALLTTDAAAAALQKLASGLSEMQKAVCQEPVQPVQKSAGQRITFDRLLSVLSLLVALLTLIATCMPDKEKQTSNANEAAMLERQQETNALLAEQNWLLQDIADALQEVRDGRDAVPDLRVSGDDLLQDAPDGVDAAPERAELDAQGKDARRENDAHDQQ